MIASMNVNSPKRTIIINTFNSKLVCPLPPRPLPFLCGANNANTETTSSKKGRKRSLDHLTFEEKLLRKKLKNREAAQTSRDRKKARMDELEKTVKNLQKRNKQVMTENELLKCEKESLRKENDKLKEELRCAHLRCTLECSGSAVSLYCPLPQGRSGHLTEVPMSFLIQSIFLQLILFIGYQKIGNAIFHHWKIYARNYSQDMKTPRITTASLMKWWGPHQHYWNPANLNYLSLLTAR